MENGHVPTATRKVILSRYVVADPKVCGGQLTFRGTRVLVADVLDQVARGVHFPAIRESWGRAIRLAAIQEAMQLAREALLTSWLPPDAAAPPDPDIPDEDSYDGVHWWQRYKTTRKIALGRYVVADPAICHGKLTIRGTRIFAADILSQAAEGRPWKWISEGWGGKVTKGAIGELVRLARAHLLRHWPQMEIPDAVTDARAGREHS